jgi:hypothetical protein
MKERQTEVEVKFLDEIIKGMIASRVENLVAEAKEKLDSDILEIVNDAYREVRHILSVEDTTEEVQIRIQRKQIL